MNPDGLSSNDRLFDLIERGVSRLGDDQWIAEKSEIQRIKWAMRGSETGDDVEPVEELKRFLNSNPRFWAAVAEEIARETLNYVNDVCSIYAEIASYRPFTEDEQAVGQELSDILNALRRFLRLGDRPVE